MISRYEIFCEVIENRSFTKTAEKLGYTQGSISQTIKSLESEIGMTLIDRKRGDLKLTPDGEEFYPLINNIRNAEWMLERKIQSMRNLENSEIKMGLSTSISRVIMPRLIRDFKALHPTVTFTVKQGEYSEIRQWILNGDIDFGFLNSAETDGLEIFELFEDEMLAILPLAHKLAEKNTITLEELAKEPLILLDEQDSDNVLLRAFKDAGIEPDIDYTGYDEYSICAMVKQRLGVSAAYGLCITGFEDGLEIRPFDHKISRFLCLGWRSWDDVPYASRELIRFIKKKVEQREL